MADASDACDTEIQSFHSPFSLPHGFLDTELYQDTVPLDDFVTETQMDNLDFGTQVVDTLDRDDEVVLDSEDEEITGIKGNLINDERTDGGQEVNHIWSEEPGESSETNALDFVDQFLLSNNVDCSSRTEVRKTARTIFSPVSCANGSQRLAKRIRTGKTGNFEWVDPNQHEAVGFFSKRMDATFDDEGCQMRAVIRKKKTEEIDSKADSSSGTRGGEKSIKRLRDVRASCHLESSNAGGGQNDVFRKAQVSDMNCESNSFTKPNEQLNAIPSVQALDDCSVETNTPDMFSAGFNTQMAAEVMESLSCCASTYGRAGDANQDFQNSHADSSKGVTKSKVQFKGPCLQNEAFSKKRKCYATKGTPYPPRKTSSRQELAPHLASKVETKRGKPLAGSLNTSGIYTNESSTGHCASLGKQMKEEEPKSESNIKKHGKYRCSSSAVENISTGKQGVKTAVEGSLGLGKGVNDVMERTIVTDRRKRSHLQKKVDEAKGSNIITYRRNKNHLGGKPSEVLIAERKSSKLSLDIHVETRNNRQDNIEISSLTDFPNLDSWTWPKGKRMHRRLASKSNGGSHKSGPFMVVDKRGHHKVFRKDLPNSPLLQELIRSGIHGSKLDFTFKDLRKRKGKKYIRVLFSQHLDSDIISQQKKILARLGICTASCLMDATHFIADRFVRTRNMLEAIALGKPVVTHLWIESCGQASCLIDEKNYILRDAKKEKEIGFNLLVSLTRSSQCPLLKGQRVLITPNTKPDKEMVASLVKAVQGQVVDRCHITVQRIPKDLLILSCEEDHQVCLPFLDKGLAIYSSELLLNGIVIQKLEYARYQLFVDHVKVNRSTKC